MTEANRPESRSARRKVAALLFTLAAIAGPAHATSSTPEQKYQLALEAQTAREYRTMMTLLRQAAEAGDVEAQEMLGMALLTGRTLYGASVKPDRCEAVVWMRRAAAQGSDYAKHQLMFLNRLRNAPSGKDACAG
jgi:TPR repeat protein